MQCRELTLILHKVAEGIRQLYSLGFVHRELKPDNIVLSLRPLTDKLIEIQRALPLSAATKGSIRGISDYYPENPYILDGDIFAMLAMTIECDMGKDEYLSVRNQRDGDHLRDSMTFLE